MKNRLKTFLSVFFGIFIMNLYAQSPAWERASKIEKGYNLANWLEAGWLGDSYPDPNAYTVENMQLFSQLGFKTVRVPVLYEWIIDENPPYNTIIDQAPFDLINSVVIPGADACDMTVLLVNHHGRPLNDANFQAEIPRIVAQWQFLTQLYADLPHDRYFFELRNEPQNDISNENLRIVQQAIIDGIRAYDTERTLIVGANWWNAAWSLTQTTPYNDNNIIYTFHSYDPFDFTHQGFSWSPQHPAGVAFSANSADADYLRSTLIDVKNWSQTNNVPIYWGEFGVSWFADAQSRCNYINFTTELADQLDIPWLYWDIKNTNDAFGIFENGVLHQDNIIPCFANAMGLVYSEDCTEVPECPPAGTPCDDGNPQTQNDVEDGNCNCAGTPVTTASCELITNGTFDSDLSPWNIWGGSASANYGWAYISGLWPPGNNPWDAGFSHSNLQIQQGKTYKITFDAYGANRNIDVRVGLSVAPYTLFHYETVSVNWSSQTYNMTFTMTEPTSTVGSLDFYFGGISGDVGLDNISLEEVDCTEQPPQCPPAGTPCDDGNPQTQNDVEDGNCNCAGQCPPAGTPCDDDNPQTQNDVEDGNCHCEGECPSAGMPCDDGNPQTQNDVEDGNCNCAGTAIPTTNCELITNGTFDTNLNPWLSWGCDPNANYGWAYIGGLWQPGSNLWDAGFSHPNLVIEQGKTYMISFDSYGDNRDVSVKVGLGVAPFTAFHYETVSVNWTGQTFTMTFTMTEPSTSSGALDFFFGGISGDVGLDNISLKEVGCTNKHSMPEPSLTIYPNPFTDKTNIEFDVLEDSKVSIFVSDVTGKKVAILADNEPMSTGTYQSVFDGRGLSSGVYYCTVVTGKYRSIYKMVLTK